jgi:transcriptional regulator with XRE-family HTH domain
MMKSDLLIAEISCGITEVEEILIDIDINFSGDLIRLYEYLINEGIKGKSFLYHFEMHGLSDTLKFVSWTNSQRESRAGNANRIRKVWPKIETLETVEDLSLEHFEMLEQIGIYSLLPARLDWLKEFHGITRSEISENTGIPMSTLEYWYHGRSSIHPFETIKLIRWLRRKLKEPSLDYEWLVATPTSNLKKSIEKIIKKKEEQISPGITIDIGQMSLLDMKGESA